MCQSCEYLPLTKFDRRQFMRGLIATAGFLASGMHALAAAEGAPPKPENVISADEAMKRLMAGNARYVNNTPSPSDFATTRAALALGQNPYASILSCADSRISPELCFDAERGDLFVTRVAGNFVTPEILASLEYGAAVLKSPLIMVLGHTSCGAINAAIKAVKNDENFPGHIQQLTSNLAPAVDAAMKKDPNNLENAAVRENVRLNVAALQNSTPILRKLVQEKKLRVVGGVYDLKTGRVDLL